MAQALKGYYRFKKISASWMEVFSLVRLSYRRPLAEISRGQVVRENFCPVWHWFWGGDSRRSFGSKCLDRSTQELDCRLCFTNLDIEEVYPWGTAGTLVRIVPW